MGRAIPMVDLNWEGHEKMMAVCRHQPGAFWVAGVHILSVLDLIFTILHLYEGGLEMNPVMALALKNGYAAFGVIKVCATTLGLLVLFLHLHIRRVRSVLRIVFALYLGILFCHLYLQFLVR